MCAPVSYTHLDVYKRQSDIPILGTSVTDYGTALGVSDWTGKTGTNISGTTDLAPLDGQAAMLKELFPDAKNVGLWYCSAEPNSKYQIDTIKPLLEKLGYTLSLIHISDLHRTARSHRYSRTSCGSRTVRYRTGLPAPQPVSYTHLDVYKRQGHCHVIAVGICKYQHFHVVPSLCAAAHIAVFYTEYPAM